MSAKGREYFSGGFEPRMGRIPLFPPSELLHGNNRIKGDSTGLRSPWFLPILCRIICVFLVTNYENHSTFHRTFVRRFAGDIFHFTIGRCPIFERGFQTPVHRAAGGRAGWSFVYLRSQGGLHHCYHDHGQAGRQPFGQFQGQRLECPGGGCPRRVSGSSSDY